MKNKKFMIQKDEILETARNLFWKKGYDATSLKDIATSCGFEASNIYYYYKNKEEILYEALRVELDRLVGETIELQETDTLNPVERLQKFIETEVKIHLGEHRLQGMLIDSELKNLNEEHVRKIIELRNEHDDILAKILSDGISQGYFKEIDIKLAVYTISSVIIRSRMWFSPTGRVSLQKYADFVFQFVNSALTVEKTPI